MEEIWKTIEIEDALTNYEISTDGRVRNKKTLKIRKLEKIKITNYGKEGYWTVALKHNKKVYRRQIHNLMMTAFKKDDRLPFFRRPSSFKHTQSIGNPGGRPSKNKAKHIPREIGYGITVEFIDGDRNNLNIENLKWFEPAVIKKDSFIYNPKYANVFYSGPALINQININTTNNNKEDNRIIIKFLEGDNNIIGKLFIKYEKYHKDTLKIFINKNKRKSTFKRKEAVLTLEDFIIESQIKILGKIKKGRFNGIDFKSWTGNVMLNYLRQYFQIERSKQLRDRTETFISY